MVPKEIVELYLRALEDRTFAEVDRLVSDDLEFVTPETRLTSRLNDADCDRSPSWYVATARSTKSAQRLEANSQCLSPFTQRAPRRLDHPARPEFVMARSNRTMLLPKLPYLRFKKLATGRQVLLKSALPPQHRTPPGSRGSAPPSMGCAHGRGRTILLARPRAV